MRTVKLLTIIIIALLVSCKKDNVKPIQVIEPGSYFPVYPNSWWKYSLNDTTIVTDSTKPDYIIHSYSNHNHPENTDSVYVPYFYSIEFSSPIYKYDRIVCPAYVGAIKWPILSEEIGFNFQRAPNIQTPEKIESVTVEAKYFNGKDSVLVQVGRFYDSWFGNVGYTQKRYQEFVKDVGLVKDITYDTVTNDTLNKKILIDYYISKGL